MKSGIYRLFISFNQITEIVTVLNLSKSRLISQVSHELKNPLNSVKLLVESSLMSESLSEIKDNLRIIDNINTYNLNTISNILDYG